MPSELNEVDSYSCQVWLSLHTNPFTLSMFLKVSIPTRENLKPLTQFWTVKCHQVHQNEPRYRMVNQKASPVLLEAVAENSLQ